MTEDDQAAAAAPSGQSPGVALNQTVVVLAAYAWRLLVIGAALVVVLWLVAQLWLVMLSLVVAILLARVLVAPAGWLRRRGWGPGLAAAVALVGFLLAAALVLALIGTAIADEAEKLGPTVSEAVDDIETWLVEDSPFDVDRRDIERFRRDLGDSVSEAASANRESLVAGAVLAVEMAVSVLLGLIVTFFLVKDGDRFVAWFQRLFPRERRSFTGRLGARAWETLGGYLRGAAMLGVIEGFVIGVTLTVVGAELAVPVAAVTFLSAFVPFVGAIVSGILAVLVALATAGATQALIVAGVALVVQQLDNDVLAPVVYGRALSLHPVVVLLSIAAGGALFGLAGSFLAVPVSAVLINVVGEARAAPADA